MNLRLWQIASLRLKNKRKKIRSGVTEGKKKRIHSHSHLQTRLKWDIPALISLSYSRSTQVILMALKRLSLFCTCFIAFSVVYQYIDIIYIYIHIQLKQHALSEYRRANNCITLSSPFLRPINFRISLSWFFVFVCLLIIFIPLLYFLYILLWFLTQTADMIQKRNI